MEGHLGIPQSEALGAKLGVGARRLAHVLGTELRAGSAQPLQPRWGPGASGSLFLPGWRSRKISEQEQEQDTLSSRHPGTSGTAFW